MPLESGVKTAELALMDKMDEKAAFLRQRLPAA